MERWSKVAAEQGLRALDQLRTGVENAVKALGRGFLACAANAELKAALKHNRLSPLEYYRQLLRVVYRFLFLFVAEDRDLLCDPSATDDAKNRYTSYYSAARLRRIAERLRGSPHTDLFEGLSLVLNKLGTTGCPELALHAFGGLFDPARTPNLAGCRLTNADLLEAVRALSVISDGTARRSVDYRNLGAEELGSVYESLLELHPRFDPDAITFTLESTSGNERKTTGSYYTHTSLISCQLDSALDPVLAEAASKPNPEEAILALTVCDSACGSGHFLIAAAHRIAKKLAAVRTLEDEPAPDAVRHALRDVIGRCIYGVDINPMAVELCQVALWMEALEPGKPLSFLDHHIQCGNSLLGTTPALLAKGIPDEAFEPIEGDDKKWCSALKRQNKEDRNNQPRMFEDAPPWEQLGNLPAAMAKLEGLPDDTVDRIREKERQYAELKTEAAYRTSGRFLADAWCAAFVWKKVKDDNLLPMTHARFRKIEKHPHDIGPQEFAEVRRLADQYQFFHWHVAFPGIFRYPAKHEKVDNEVTGWCGGFSVMLGNPPWDLVTADGNGPGGDTLDGLQKMYGTNAYSILSGRRDLYKLFLVLSPQLVSNMGRVGLLTPLGFFVEDDSADCRKQLFDTGTVTDLRHFQNQGKSFFPTVHGSYRFCMVCWTSSQLQQHCFWSVAGSPSELTSQYAVVIQREDFSLYLGEHRSAALYESQHHATTHTSIVRRLARSGRTSFRVTAEFHASTDKALLTTVQAAGDWIVLKNRNIHQFDPSYAPPEVFVSSHRVMERMQRKNLPAQWGGKLPRLLFRDIARNDDERTLIACLAPPGMVSTYDTPFAVPDADEGHVAVALCYYAAVFNSFLFDFVIRPYVDKHIKGYVLNRVPWPQVATEARIQETPASEWIARRVIELTYTREAMREFAKECDYSGDPYVWDDIRRSAIRAELDAAVFQLFGISDADAAYILDMFPIVRSKDIEAHGNYRTKDTILQLYRQYSQPELTVPQYDMLRAMACVAAFVETYGRRIGMNVLETGLVLMVNESLRKSYLKNTPLPGRKPGRKHPTLLDWMPLAIERLLANKGLQIDPNSPEGLPLYNVGPSPFGVTDLPSYRAKATEALQVMKQIGDEQTARTVVEEYTDEPSQLVPV